MSTVKVKSKEEIVSDIIKRKNVNMVLLKHSETPESYNRYRLLDEQLNPDEFAILKETLK